MLIGRKVEFDNNIKEQSLKDHLNGVVKRSRKFNKVDEFDSLITIMALLHDTGKALPSWQNSIKRNKKLPPHSRLGMVLNEKLFEKFISENTFDKNELRKIYTIKDMISYTIGSHHGLFDAIDIEGRYHKIDYKIQTEINNPELNEGINNYFEEIDLDFDSLYKIYEKSILDSFEIIQDFTGKDDLFYISIMLRNFISIIEDADWSDAAAFSYSLEDSYTESLKSFSFEKFRNNLEDYIEENFKNDTDLNKIRSKISDECKDSSNKTPGIFKISVPTGSGKTIAAMRFALNHAVKYNKDRIFYLAPYISILEQNAKEYKNLLTNSKEDEKFILEYHSNLIYNKDDEESEIQKYLGENFQAPIILTTLVGALDIFLSDNKQSLRKLHRFQNSVVIIDEIQAVPLEVYSLLNLCINAINKYYNTTFVICSATIPDVEQIKMKGAELKRINYKEKPYLTSDYNMKKPFQRVKVNSLLEKGMLTKEDCGDLLEKVLEKRKSILFITNTRKAAKLIFQELKDRDLGIPIYHLSNNMCPAHRLEVLDKIKSHNINDPHIIISTNLIEAGVDLSVGAVIRSVTKLDSILQAMGRCNRNNELEEKGLVYIVRLDKDLENINKLFEVYRGQDISIPKLKLFFKNPEEYGGDISSKIFLEKYFNDFYNGIEEKTYYKVNEKDISTTGYDILSNNEKALRNYVSINKKMPKHIINQGFKTFGDKFKVIKDEGIGVIVPYKEGEDFIGELLSDIELPLKYKILRKAQRYSINIYKNKVDELIDVGALDIIEDLSLLVLKDGFYDNELGIVTESGIKEDFIL